MRVYFKRRKKTINVIAPAFFKITLPGSQAGGARPDRCRSRIHAAAPATGPRSGSGSGRGPVTAAGGKAGPPGQERRAF